MTDHTDRPRSPERLDHATHVSGAARVRAVAGARSAVVDARVVYDAVREQIVYAALLEGESVREIARTYGMPKSDVGRIARRVRDLPAESNAARPPGGSFATRRHQELLEECWNGAVIEPVSADDTVRPVRLDDLSGLDMPGWACFMGPVGSGKSAILRRIAREQVRAGRIVVVLETPHPVEEPQRTDDPPDYAATGADVFFDFQEFQRRVENLISQRPDRRPLVIIDGVWRRGAIAIGQWANQAASPDQVQLVCATNSFDTPLVRELGLAVSTVVVIDPFETPGVVTGTIAREPEYRATPWKMSLRSASTPGGRALS